MKIIGKNTTFTATVHVKHSCNDGKGQFFFLSAMKSKQLLHFHLKVIPPQGVSDYVCVRVCVV